MLSPLRSRTQERAQHNASNKPNVQSKLLSKIIADDVKTTTNNNELREEINTAAMNTVKECVRRLNHYLLPHISKKKIFDLTIFPIGSVAERTKVGQADEFDYLLVLKPNTDHAVFELDSDNLPVTSVKNHIRSYCKVRSRKDHHSRFILDGQFTDPETGYLKADELYKSFRSIVQEVVKWFEYVIEQSGPALSLYCSHPLAPEQHIKVDLCLALETTIPEANQCLWKNDSAILLPRHLLPSEELPHWNFTQCHVICSGQLWKLSVCAAEIEHMKYINATNAEMITVYKALKVAYNDCFSYPLSSICNYGPI